MPYPVSLKIFSLYPLTVTSHDDIVAPSSEETNMTTDELFAEFERPATQEEIEAILSKSTSAAMPDHWEMFDPPEVRRIRPEGV